jgi:hypothetical protein
MKKVILTSGSSSRSIIYDLNIEATVNTVGTHNFTNSFAASEL